MNKEFWQEKWERKEIAFHGSETNPLLVKHFNQLRLKKNAGVFVPLCGKTLDIGWLLSQGYRIAGAELSQIAVEELFEELRLKPAVSETGTLKRYSAQNIDLFCGDIFEITAAILGPIDAVYDRAALVALPETMRPRYTAHLSQITRKAPQLLICYDYDQKQMEGPPFSISDSEVHHHYKNLYNVTLIESETIPGGLKGKCPAKENVWLLTEKT